MEFSDNAMEVSNDEQSGISDGDRPLDEEEDGASDGDRPLDEEDGAAVEDDEAVSGALEDDGLQGEMEGVELHGEMEGAEVHGEMEGAQLQGEQDAEVEEAGDEVEEAGDEVEEAGDEVEEAGDEVEEAGDEKETEHFPEQEVEQLPEQEIEQLPEQEGEQLPEKEAEQLPEQKSELLLVVHQEPQSDGAVVEAETDEDIDWSEAIRAAGFPEGHEPTSQERSILSGVKFPTWREFDEAVDDYEATSGCVLTRIRRNKRLFESRCRGWTKGDDSSCRVQLRARLMKKTGIVKVRKVFLVHTCPSHLHAFRNGAHKTRWLKNKLMKHIQVNDGASIAELNRDLMQFHETESKAWSIGRARIACREEISGSAVNSTALRITDPGVAKAGPSGRTARIYGNYSGNPSGNPKSKKKQAVKRLTGEKMDPENPQAEQRQKRLCGLCRQPGHDRRQCTARLAITVATDAGDTAMIEAEADAGQEDQTRPWTQSYTEWFEENNPAPPLLTQ